MVLPRYQVSFLCIYAAAAERAAAERAAAEAARLAAEAVSVSLRTVASARTFRRSCGYLLVLIVGEIEART
jgi:hypothetical protein